MLAEQLEIQALPVGKWHIRGRRSVECYGGGSRLSWCLRRCVSSLVLDHSAWGKLDGRITAGKRCSWCRSWFRRNLDYFGWPRAPGRRWVTCALLPGTNTVGTRRPLFIAFNSPQPGRERLVSILFMLSSYQSACTYASIFCARKALYILAVAATRLDFWLACPRPLWPL